MTARRLIGVLAAGVLLAAPSAANAEFAPAGSDQRYVPGEAIVRFEPGVAAAERRDARGDASVSFDQSLGLRRAQVVSFDGPVRAAIERLEDQPEVAYAQPNYRYHALAAAPNDTYFEAGDQWGLSGWPGSVGVLPAWDRSRGAGQVIAIVDTGVDLTHPDLAGNLWTGPGGIHGMDFVDGDTDPDDFNLHGTHVAGIAAAIADNDAGVAGVAPLAQIMAVRVLDADGGGTTSDIVEGINFAATNGATVVNMSLGGPPDAGDTAMSNAIFQAEQANVVVVAAAGNESEDNDELPTTPCTFGNANLICVAAVTRTGARSGFSNFGRTTVDLGAPGGDLSGAPDRDIVSTKPFWKSLLFEDFQSGIDGWTASHVSGLDWGLAGGGIGGESATDSPGANYQPNTDSMLEHTPIDLAGERGCRLDYYVRMVDIEDPDSVGVGVFSSGGTGVGQDLAGDTGSSFQLFEQSISELDGETVTPTFVFNSDGTVQGDGGYVDDFSLLCRGDGPYGDDIASDDAASGGAYTAIAGTSMAAPHVAGVAALVRAVDPGAPPAQVVEALRRGARPAPGMAGVTVTGGVVDAVGAMDAALAIPNGTPPPPPPPPPPATTPPHRPRFGKARVSRRGVVSIVVRSDPATTGVLTLSANITAAARVRTVGRKRFRLGARRAATVRVKLRRPARRQLNRRHTMRLRVKAVVRNAAGLTSSRTARIRIRQRRTR